MTNKLLLFIAISILSMYSYSQELQIKGFVKYNNTPISDVLIKLSSSDNKTISITNELGLFEVKKFQTNSDSITIDISKTGYIDIKKILATKDVLTNLVFNIEEKIIALDEVTINASKSLIKSNKTTYKISSKDFIKNSKSDKALQTLPNISITNEGVLVDNRKKAVIFIDGIESSIDDLKRLDVKEVNKIDVISNPSASYGTDNINAVIQVITKVKKEKFIKGEIETYTGVRLGKYGLIPTLSIKTKHIIFKTFYSFGTNNQIIKSELIRNDNNNYFNQKNERIIDGWQDFFNTKIKINITEKSSLNISGNLFRYKFEGNNIGNYENNIIATSYKIVDLEKLNKWSIASVYNYNINLKSKLLVKFKYFDYKNQNKSFYTENNGNQILNNIFSNTKETSEEIVFEKKEVNILKFPIEYVVGYKNIYRKFYFQTSNFDLNQYINTLYANTDIEVNEKFSVYISLATDFTKNKNPTINQKYTTLLPTFSALYKLNDKINLNLDFSRKMTRPSANYLNPELIFFNPSFSLQGNTNLLPETRNIYEIGINKQLKNKNSISFKFFNENTTNAIAESFINNNNTITNTYENIGKVKIYGGNVGFNAKLFKHLTVNLNTGLTYNNYESKSEYTLIKENKGFSFNSNLNVSTIVKKRISLSLNGTFNSPNYSLISRTYTSPLFTFEAESTFLRDKLNVRFSYFDIFGFSTITKDKISNTNFNQISTRENKITNFTISLIYNFGKTFSDRFSNPVINNDDIKIK